jgi:5-formyltetrahydrofolate cyclo-ligase
VTSKDEVREKVWAFLEREGAARFPGARGRIPNFKGAEAAAEILAAQSEWVQADVMKSNPDSPQLPVRTRALADGKVLFMAVPRLSTPKPFLRLDPRRLSGRPREAASIKGASRLGRPVTIRQMRHVDLIVCGSVAVNHLGARVGKGGGFSDLEFALLTDAGLVDDRTVVATTIHPLQLLDEPLPETGHDFRVDLIVTPEETIRPAKRSRRRPRGIVWADLTPEKIEQIPALRALRPGAG